MIAFAVHHRDRRLHIAGLRELARWPYHGLVGMMAFRFDGRRLQIVRLKSLDRPTALTRYRA